MKNFLICLLAVVLTASMYCAKSQTIKHIEHDSQQRAYMEFVPSTYTGSEPVPLVLALHGLGDTITNFQAVGFQALGEIDNFITVYPQGMNVGLGAAWNAGILLYGTINLNGTVDDIGFINLLLDTLISQYNIDQTKIYAAGFSNGGFMVNRFACELSNRFTALAAAAGTRGNLITACNPWRAIPYCHFHGNEDPTVPYTGNTFGMDAPDLVEWWTIFNQCDNTPNVTSFPDNAPGDSITVTLFEFPNGRDGTTVEFYLADNGGHQWLYEPVNDVTYTRLMWEFFKKFSMVNLGIDDEMNQSITVYPIPANDEIIIRLSDNIGQLNFDLFNTNGQLVIQKKFSDSENILNVDELPDGIYFWKAICDNQMNYSGKILVIHN